MEKNKWKMIAVLLIMLIAVFLISIGIKNYWNKIQESYQEGLQDGYDKTVVQVFEQASTCRQIPIRAGNQTIHIIAVECLQR